MVGLALTMSTSAGAIINIGLTQVGGTYDGVSANPGDTLVLNITYDITGASATTLVDPSLVFNGSVTSFDVAASTETGYAIWGAGNLANIGTGDIALVTPQMANGWEKGTLAAPGTVPCVFGECTSMGTAVFVLSGTSGVISIGGVGAAGGTVVGDGTFVDIAGDPAQVTLGTFTVIPEPTTASLLGLGLLGLTIAGRRRN